MRYREVAALAISRQSNSEIVDYRSAGESAFLLRCAASDGDADSELINGSLKRHGRNGANAANAESLANDLIVPWSVKDLCGKARLSWPRRDWPVYLGHLRDVFGHFM
jgi:hypothetical protein